MLGERPPLDDGQEQVPARGQRYEDGCQVWGRSSPRGWALCSRPRDHWRESSSW